MSAHKLGHLTDVYSYLKPTASLATTVSVDGPVHYGWLSIEYGYSRGIYCDYRSGGYLYWSGGQIDPHNDYRVSFDLIYTGSGNAGQHGQCKLQVASTFGNHKGQSLRRVIAFETQL